MDVYFSSGIPNIKSRNRAIRPSSESGSPMTSSLSDLLNHALNATTPGTSTSFIAITHAIGGSKRVRTKAGKTVDKQEFLVVADTNTRLVCTSWGRTAPKLSDANQGEAVLILDGQVSDYNGTRSVNIEFTASTLFKPTLQRTHQFRAWYSQLPPNPVFQLVRP